MVRAQAWFHRQPRWVQWPCAMLAVPLVIAGWSLTVVWMLVVLTWASWAIRRLDRQKIQREAHDSRSA